MASSRFNLDEGDELISTRLTDGTSIFSSERSWEKRSIFRKPRSEKWAEPLAGSEESGFSKGDEVVGMEVVAPHTQILTVTENGYGKRSSGLGIPDSEQGRIGHLYGQTDARRREMSSASRPWSMKTN